MQKSPGGIDLDVLKQAISIIDLAKILGLQVRGKQARCFNASRHKHADKNPSLGFDLESNRFKCFACGLSGSIIDLYVQVKDVGVSQAISELADMAGELSRKTPKKTHKKGINNKDNSDIYMALRDYCGELDAQSLIYLTGANRGLTEETIDRFRIFAIKDYPATNNFMRNKFSVERLQEAGLVSEQGNLIFYQHKIITPFYQDGKIIFLQGRRTDDQRPRYMQIKKEVPLFNLDTLKDLKPGDKVYLCEGVFDAMMLEQNGYRAVAVLGVNNFKPEMIQIFNGLDIVLCLDNDESGRRGMRLLATLFLLNGQSVKTKLLPEGVKDITEYFIRYDISS